MNRSILSQQHRLKTTDLRVTDSEVSCHKWIPLHTWDAAKTRPVRIPVMTSPRLSECGGRKRVSKSGCFHAAAGFSFLQSGSGGDDPGSMRASRWSHDAPQLENGTARTWPAPLYPWTVRQAAAPHVLHCAWQLLAIHLWSVHVWTHEGSRGPGLEDTALYFISNKANIWNGSIGYYTNLLIQNYFLRIW